MPYIPSSDRQAIDAMVRPARLPFLSSGQLNYLITKILLHTEPSSYMDYMALVGTLECVKLELYRRAVARYEDGKKKENGDVY